MEDSIRRIKVFLASPGDVSEERNQLPKVIQEINLIISAIAPEKKILLDLITWETNAYPALGKDAQDVINKQLPECDIFIGIMWKRFGTPTSVAGSGTEEEFNQAYSKWERNNNFPVLFYFCQNSYSLPNLEEIEQLRKVIKFKENLSKKGLIWEYKDQKGFADVIRPHLVMSLSKMLTSSKSITPSIEETRQMTTESDISIVRQRVNELKTEYENLRNNMEAGNARTRLMAVIESKMRAIALQIFPILPDLINSVSPGDRLAAIATLKEIPDPRYLTWLGNRTGKAETPFVGYNAALALLAAARDLGSKYRNELNAAITSAIANLNNSEYKDPNQVEVLDEAQKEIRSSKHNK